MVYFFDSRDSGRLSRDDVGVELGSPEEARKLATQALGEWAKDAIPGAERKQLAIEVRADASGALLKAALWVEVTDGK